MKYCNNCEEYVEAWDGRCPLCNNRITVTRKKTKLDEFEENDSEWGTEDEVEEIELR